ncbi:FMN-binding negative transcriptional regulator [Anderseniella sp. Alg231-50]|uniref:FMN-binding negative transcriptional regulator n=1 Tax=Anderseniella sp. Alg231-50 TaxID=1922226 RepID=UPI000D55F187
MADIVYARDTSRETSQPVLLEAARAIQLAALVTSTSDGSLKVSHLPLLVSELADGTIRLCGHFARANDHWKIIESGDALTVAIFQGPHTYLSPSNYASKQETGKVVPTWAYVIVHAHGVAGTVHDADRLLAHVNALTDRNEAEQPAPWKVSDAPDDYVAKMLRGIVGVELSVSRLEGVWKMNQHRSDADKASTTAGLAASNNDRDRQLGRVMTDTLATLR